MANKAYISAGLSVKKSSGASSTTNNAYISAGLTPKADTEPPPVGAIIPLLQKNNLGASLYNGSLN